MDELPLAIQLSPADLPSGWSHWVEQGRSVRDGD